MHLTGKKIVSQAETWLGTKYHHQGRLKKNSSHLGGVDCIGLIMGVAKELKIKSKNGKYLAEYDRFNYSAISDGKSLTEFLEQHLHKIKNSERIKAGDIILFKMFKDPQHVGIATNDEMGNIGIIHCYSGSKMVVKHLLSPAWIRMIVDVYKFYK